MADSLETLPAGSNLNELKEQGPANIHGGIEIVWGKLHGLRVTGCALDYHGSITIDADILRAGGLIPLEFVYIWNKSNGARLSTYILPGEPKSGICCLNGAAVRTCQVGDELIVAGKRIVTGIESVLKASPKVVTFTHTPKINTIFSAVSYQLQAAPGPEGEAGQMVFQISEHREGG